MPSALIVGDRGSGRTFFLGLLYASMVRYSGEARDGLRFHAPPAALDVLSHLYESFRAGEGPEWPSNAPGSLPLTLEMPSGHHGSRLQGLWHAPPGVSRRALEIVLERSNAEELQQFVSSGGAMTGFGQSLLSGGALLVTVDASALAPPADGRPVPHPWDSMLAQLLRGAKQAARDHPSPTPRRLSLVLILTKYDRIAPPSRSALVRDGATADGWTEATRKEASDNLLARFLPSTRAELLDGPSAGLLLEGPWTFLSWVRPEAPVSSPMRLRGHETSERGWEPEYPYLEYRDLIDHLGRLASADR